jgi:hypothetical protein
MAGEAKLMRLTLCDFQTASRHHAGHSPPPCISIPPPVVSVALFHFSLLHSPGRCYSTATARPQLLVTHWHDEWCLSLPREHHLCNHQGPRGPLTLMEPHQRPTPVALYGRRNPGSLHVQRLQTITARCQSLIDQFLAHDDASPHPNGRKSQICHPTYPHIQRRTG